MPYNKNSIKPYLIIVLATLLLYVWQLHLYPMINPDGVTYIEAAAAYLKGGFKAAVAIDSQARWPFYSILIAKVYSYSGLPMVIAERVLDATFISVSACLFLYLVRLFSKHDNASFWAILVWITWHEYIRWWPTVVRDHGFLTCLLFSFFCYYRFILTQRFLWALAWSVVTIAAEFFRIEAVLYLLFIPFFVFFLPNLSMKHRMLLWLKLNTLTLIGGAGVIFLFVNKTLTIDSLRFEYMLKEFSLLWFTIVDEFMKRYKIVHLSIFYRENHYAGYALVVAYISTFIAYVVAQISLAILLPIVLMKCALKKLNRVMLQQPFLAYLSIAGLTPLFFFAEHVFLNGRYLLPLGMIVLVFAASIFPHIVEVLTGKKKFLFVGLSGVLLLINFLANIFLFGHVSQDYYIVGTWLKEHYPNKTVFTNKKTILFYDSSSPDYKNGNVYEMKWGGVGNVWLRAHDDWCQYGLLVLAAPEGESENLKTLFVQLQAKNVLGPTIKSYTRAINNEGILVAPVHTAACMAMIHQS